MNNAVIVIRSHECCCRSIERTRNQSVRKNHKGTKSSGTNEEHGGPTDPKEALAGSLLTNCVSMAKGSASFATTTTDRNEMVGGSGCSLHQP